MANELIATNGAALAALVAKSTGESLTAAEYSTLLAALKEANAATRTANTVLAGPTSGGAAQPTFRALVAADLPTISEIIDDRVAALLQQGSGVTLTYDDNAGTLTIAASGGGGASDPLTLGAAKMGTGFQGGAEFATTNEFGTAGTHGVLLLAGIIYLSALNAGSAHVFRKGTATAWSIDGGSGATDWHLFPDTDMASDAGKPTKRIRAGHYGGLSLKGRTITSNASWAAGDSTVYGDCTSGAVQYTLPPASAAQWEIAFKKIDSTGNNFTIARAGSDTIEGATSAVIGAQYAARTFRSDGVSVWYEF